MWRRSAGCWAGIVLGVGQFARAEAQVRPAAELTCVVARISDGDSFRCQDGLRVRMIGIDSPESDQAPFGAAARSALTRLMRPGSRVRLETDIDPTDRYGRVLAYVWLGSTMINEALVREGWAVLYTVPPNVKYAERIRLRQNEARTRGAGLWSRGGFECLPSDFRRKRCVSSP